MRTRSIGAITALILLPLTLSFAGPPPSLEERGGPDPIEQVAQMVEALGLSSTQADAIETILTDAQEEGRALRQEGRAAFEALESAVASEDDKEIRQALKEVDDVKQRGRTVREDARAAIRAELDVVQQGQLELLEMKRHHRQRKVMEHVRERRGERDGRNRDDL